MDTVRGQTTSAIPQVWLSQRYGLNGTIETDTMNICGEVFIDRFINQLSKGREPVEEDA